MMVIEWTKTCCYVALKLNICIRWQVSVFIHTDNVLLSFMTTGQMFYILKWTYPCSVPVQRDMLHTK